MNDDRSDVIISCVAEPTKKYLEQAARLLMSLRWFGGSLSDARFVVGCTGGVPPVAVELFSQFNAEIVSVARHDFRHGPSNKVSLLASPALAGHQTVLLVDCDTIVVRDPGAWLQLADVAAKIADRPTVSLPELEGIFRHFGRVVPAPRYVHELTGDPTMAYCNSGVLVLREVHRTRLASDWCEWNRAVLDAPRNVLFDRHFADQVSLALAIEGSLRSFAPLPAEMNMPGHLRSYPFAWQQRDPVIVHYHLFAEPNGFLKSNALIQCSRRIKAFNRRLHSEMQARNLARWYPMQFDD